jgi:hypothetical protein
MRYGGTRRAIAGCASALVLLGSVSVAAASAAPSPLTSLAPHGVTDCGPLPKSDDVPGLVGLTATTYCYIGQLGGNSTFFAYQFANAGDYATSLAAINAFHGFDPAAVSTECPQARNSFGVVPWSNSAYPARSGQVLECQEGEDKANDPFVTPQYTWTLPSKNVIFIALSTPHLTMEHMQSWWVKTTGTDVQTKSTASPRTPLSTLLSIMPSGTADCDPTPSASTVTGTVGMVIGVNCSLPQVGRSATVYGAIYATAADYATSLAALNSFRGIEPAHAGASCPLGAGEAVGLMPWHDEGFPATGGQDLECTMVPNGGSGPPIVPDYIWTVPSDHAVLEAFGAPNSTTQQLGTWWTAHAQP